MKTYDIMGYEYGVDDIDADDPVFIRESDREDAERHGESPVEIIGWDALVADIIAADEDVSETRQVTAEIAQASAQWYTGSW